MSNTTSLVAAAIGTVALMVTPAVAQSRHHHNASPDTQALSVLDPTMYLVTHDIPVQDKTTPNITSSNVTSSTSQTASVRSRSVSHGAAAAYASVPQSFAAEDPTMYLVNHDIPVKDKTTPGF